MIIEIITNLGLKNTLIDLVGHCIGGNIAVATSTIMPNSIRTLTLLSTAWDFSHFAVAQNMQKYFNLDNYVQNLPMIPKLHIQILFFLLLPNHFSMRLDKFFTITSLEARDLSFRVENWLMSGTAIARSTYRQIIDDIISDNMLAKLQWRVNNVIIDPALIDKPVYQIIANDDKIVPKSSILALHRLLKKSKLFEIAGGHISYLINDNLPNLFEEYTK
jgi:polyhydroxyalkanoate synthase